MNALKGWALRPARDEDVEPVAELKAVVMRDDLTRLGRYDDQRVRQRLRDGFRPAHTSVIELAGAFAGCVAFGPYPHGPGRYLEHFYLAPEAQGRGLGTAVLRTLLARADAESAPVRLTVVQGSAARRLYEREGFRVEAEDPIDVLMVREPVVAAAFDGYPASSTGSAISAVPIVRKPRRA
ncbi:GNAT family N-acetyltransferase [Streptomyces sp. NPDC101160]|uniref:GNAT family N-acetyltransferase n=1 Tax=Streptomyces sp. NPDC101160 TaxID=3366118 RepID=UPI00381464B0